MPILRGRAIPSQMLSKKILYVELYTDFVRMVLGALGYPYT